MCKSRWPITTLNSQNAYAIMGNQNVICNGRNVRLMLVLLTYLRIIWELGAPAEGSLVTYTHLLYINSAHRSKDYAIMSHS